MWHPDFSHSCLQEMQRHQDATLSSLSSLQLATTSQGMPGAQQQLPVASTGGLSPPPPPPPLPVQNGYGQYVPQQQQHYPNASAASMAKLLAYMASEGRNNTPYSGQMGARLPGLFAGLLRGCLRCQLRCRLFLWQLGSRGCGIPVDTVNLPSGSSKLRFF